MKDFQLVQQLKKNLKKYKVLRFIKSHTRTIRMSALIALIELNVLLIILVLYFSSRVIVPPKVSSSSPIVTSAFPYVNKSSLSSVSAKSYIVFDNASRVIVSSKNENLTFQPASTAKIMTAIVALEYYSQNQILTAVDIAAVEGSKMKLFEGEKISVRNLLFGLMLPSGNDAAYVLAQNYPGGVEGFVMAMNKKAADLKLYSTHFTDPSGYSDSNITSAFDLVRLASYALQNATFAQIVRTKEKIVTDINGYPHDLVNLNKLLSKNGVVGVKTGFTEEAGGVLVTSIVNNNKTYIVVVLKSDDRFFDTDQLLDSVVANVKYIKY